MTSWTVSIHSLSFTEPGALAFQYSERRVGSVGDPIVPDLALLRTDADERRGFDTRSAKALLQDSANSDALLACTAALAGRTRALKLRGAEPSSPTCSYTSSTTIHEADYFVRETQDWHVPRCVRQPLLQSQATAYSMRANGPRLQYKTVLSIVCCAYAKVASRISICPSLARCTGTTLQGPQGHEDADD